MQRHAEASSEIKRAQELDPFSISLRLHEARLLHLARRSDEALKMTLELLKKAQPTAGNYYGLGFIYEGNGMYEEAVTAFRQAISIGGETTGGLCYLANALALAGKRREALEIVDRLNRTPEYVSPTELARVYTLLNDKEAALKLLERAYAERDLQLQTLNIDLHLDNLRSDPRFQDLVKRVGLP